MSPTLVALVAFAAWTGLLVFGLANFRISIAMRTQKPLNSFSPSGDDIQGLGQRWTRAHLNCLEFLPVFGAVGLAAVASGRTAVTDPLAMVVLYSRIAQSIVHLIGVSVPLVLVRATLFVVQLLIVLWWSYQLLTG
jgi:uncharacterized MAPEG superfamily protein